jgi:phage repressor protein C with HTH and peptisase S24 domain
LDHKIHGKIIKRVQSINKNGLFVSGDNKSYDSSITNECQPIQSLIGKVFYKV